MNERSPEEEGVRRKTDEGDGEDEERNRNEQGATEETRKKTDDTHHRRSQHPRSLSPNGRAQRDAETAAKEEQEARHIHSTEK